MNKNIMIGVGVVAVLLIVLGVYGVSMKKDGATMGAKMEDSSETMMKDEMMKDKMMDDKMPLKEGEEVEAMGDMDKDDMMKKEDGATDGNMMKKGVYEAYAPEKVLRAETGDVVLFFSASWCPSCRGLNSDIEANVSVIPEGVSILKLDYDKEVELKKKYGVTYQHTLVQVDKDGNLIKKWSGSSSLTKLLAEVE